MISVRTAISYPEFSKLRRERIYRKPIVVLFNVYCLLLIGSILFYFLIKDSLNNALLRMLLGGSLLILEPVFINIVSRKMYYSDPGLKEEAEYQLTDSGIKIIGKTFTSERGWNSLYKIEEFNKWFLLFENRQNCMIISQKDMSAAQIIEARNFLKNVKTNAIKKFDFKA